MLMTFIACGQSPTSAERADVTKERTIIIMAAGDSITAASYPMRLQGLFDQSQKKILVYNFGQMGFTSGMYLDYLKTSSVIDQINPDYVLLQLGTNDVRIDSDHTPTPLFVHHINSIITLFQQHRNPCNLHPTVLLSTIPPIVKIHPHFFTEESQRRVVEEINPALFEIARERQCHIIDTYELFIMHPDTLPDIHPIEEGYQLMAENWYAFIQPLLIVPPSDSSPFPRPNPAIAY
jgi:lysophospholipase L1-like esterase